jgi:hypothetical protein
MKMVHLHASSGIFNIYLTLKMTLRVTFHDLKAIFNYLKVIFNLL